MDVKKTQRQIEEAIQDGTFLTKASNYNSHFENHVTYDDKASMERCLSDVHANSMFDAEADANYLIEEAVLFHSADIAEWMTYAEYYERKAFDVSLDPEDYGNVGHGLVFDKHTNLIKEYETDTVRVILQNNPNRPLGFTVLTAYPNMESPSVTPTGRDLTEIVKETSQYQEADAVGKAYLLYRTDPRNKASVSYRRGNNGIAADSIIYMDVPTKNPEIHHVIRIKERECSMRTVIDDGPFDKKAIPSKYTQTRDKIYPDRKFGNLSVNLSRPEIRDMFFKDHPAESKAIGAMLRTIRTERKDPGETRTKGAESQADRVKRAEDMRNRCVSDITRQEEDTASYT